MTPDLSVVVPTFQRRGALRRLLAALSDQTLPPECFEVVVAIDGSTDGTREMLEGFHAPFGLRWLWQPNSGRASARNAAIRAAAGDVVVILDDDMEPQPPALEAHLREHSAPGRRCVMGAAPIVLEPDAPPHIRYVAAKFNEHLVRLGQPDHRFRIRDFYSGNTSVRRDELLAAGLYDERFKLYGNEDLELAQRLMRRGVALAFSADAVALQHYDKSLRDLTEDELAKGRTVVLLADAQPDVVLDLKIGALRADRARRRAIRQLLLWCTRGFRRTPDAVVALMALAGRLGPRQSYLVQQLALEYFYLLGVETELRARSVASIRAAKTI
jgi:glycosyltransferase involved in cell wall biosynthesis